VIRRVDLFVCEHTRSGFFNQGFHVRVFPVWISHSMGMNELIVWHQMC